MYINTSIILLELNNLITTILQQEVMKENKFSELELEYLFVEAMPHQWRYQCQQQVGKKAYYAEPFDELAQFYHLFHACNPLHPQPHHVQDDDCGIPILFIMEMDVMSGSIAMIIKAVKTSNLLISAMLVHLNVIILFMNPIQFS